MPFVLEPLLPLPPPPTQSPIWTCAYCGQSNAAEREGCRSCQAPRTEEPACDSLEIRVFGGESITVHARSEPEPRPINPGWNGYLRAVAEQGNESMNRTIIQRVKQFVGLR